jgi:Mce-associated membrane protein
MAVDADAAAEELGEPIDEEPDIQDANEDDVDEGDTENGVDIVDKIGVRTGVRLVLLVASAIVIALAGLTTWLGFRAYESHQAQQQRQLFVQVARQAALNLTTIDYTRVDADVQRILDSATGKFRDDFQRRSQPFIDVVRQAQSKSEGAITDAGLESKQGSQAQVLVAVTVKTSNAGATEQQPRAWRMRISVQQVGDGAKVSNVEFVP